VEQAFTYQLHPYNSVFTVELVIPCKATKKVVIECYPEYHVMRVAVAMRQIMLSGVPLGGHVLSLIFR